MHSATTARRRRPRPCSTSTRPLRRVAPLFTALAEPPTTASLAHPLGGRASEVVFVEGEHRLRASGEQCVAREEVDAVVDVVLRVRDLGEASGIVDAFD